MKIYIAVIGQTCAGKGTIFEIFNNELGGQYSVSSHRSSNPLNEILDIIMEPKSRPNQQGLSTDLRARFGEGLIGKIMQQRILADKADIVFFDGARRINDIEMMRKIPNSFVLYVHAPIEERYERLKKRADRPGDAQKTWEEFQNEQSAEAESLIETLRPMADFELDNSLHDPEFKALRAQVVGFINEKLNLLEKGETNVS